MRVPPCDSECVFQLCLEFEERPNLLSPPVRPYDDLRVQVVPNSFAIANYEHETPSDAVMGNIHVAGNCAISSTLQAHLLQEAEVLTRVCQDNCLMECQSADSLGMRLRNKATVRFA